MIEFAALSIRYNNFGELACLWIKVQVHHFLPVPLKTLRRQMDLLRNPFTRPRRNRLV